MPEERIWTPAQARAIGERSRTLLLSAAAGSGKTATLTERVIRTITDPENPTDITRLLVVTFTKAAASELRDRISAAIGRALADDPGSPRLSRQLLLLPDADICTIDGFCNKLLREHAADASLSPDFRVTDEAEADLIMKRCMQALLNSAFAGEKNFADREDFSRFADHFVGAKTEAELSDILIDLYEKTGGFPNGVGYFREYTETVSRCKTLSPEETPWGKALLASLGEEANGLLCEARTLSSEFPPNALPYIKTAESDITALEALCRAVKEGYEQARDVLLGFSALALSAIKEPNEATVLFRDALHPEIKKMMNEWKIRFAYSLADWHALLAEFGDVMRILSALLTEFDEMYRAEKRVRNAVTFNDLEHLTLSLLIREGEPTALAREIAANYDAIYIDEYQDVNSLQHSIFEAISLPRNRFMVGDIKQSIYSFRLAEPEIFADLRRRYPPIDQAQSSDTASIFMSENFRCDPTVIDFVNAVFDRLLGVAGDSIGYKEEDRLAFSKHLPEGSLLQKARVSIFHVPSTVYTEGGRRFADPDRLPEPIYVANEIKRLLREATRHDGEPLQPSDIAILLRTRTRAPIFCAELTRLGIPVVNEEKKSFFLNPEILLALSLLNAIDNPRRDIHLAGVMASPLYDFSPDEMVSIRAASPADIPLYDALVRYSELHPEYLRGKQFLKELNELREHAEGISCDRLILELFRDTKLLSVGGADGTGGRQNLLLLYSFARSFSASSFKGLYQFIEYVNEIILNDQDFETGGQADINAVRIMTIHGSKGLEFPVCFVADCGKSIAPPDRSRRWFFEPSLGLGLSLRDKTGFATVDNPIRQAIASRIKRKNTEEQMRLLYVALTRARERLYVTGTIAKNRNMDTLRAKCARKHRSLTASAIYGSDSYIELILAAIGDAPQEAELKFVTDLEIEENAGGFYTKNEEDHPADPATTALLEERFSYCYPHSHLRLLPRKLSVSHLSPNLLDGANDAALTLPAYREGGARRLPRIYGGIDTADAARRGTATHEFLQFCDFRALADTSAEAELSRLIADGFLPQEYTELVRTRELAAFRESRLLRELLCAKMLRRELRFNCMLPAFLFTEEDAVKAKLGDRTVLVQGVIDCVFENEKGELILLDYKTDRFPPEEKVKREDAVRSFMLRHREQLFYYTLATEKLFGRLPDRVLLFPLALGEPVPVQPSELLAPMAVSGE